ncbi:MAG TPA: TIGR00366 family protein [Desulfomonilaceae bacterium]|nr:TIGR00366 family protein [Desulfomonilaceae bacterium]
MLKEQKMPEQNGNNNESTMLSRFTEGFAQWAFRWIPDALVFALILTVIVFFAGWGLTKHDPEQLVGDWIKGFWVLLTFAMQMCLLMITGFIVADSKYVKAGLMKLVDIPKTRTQTILFYSVFMCVIMWFHWGIGLMVGIIMGRAIAVKKRGMKIHYPFIAAIAYLTALVDNGPSQAAQLLMATPGNFMEKVAGVIPLTQSAFDIKLLLTNLVLLMTIPILLLAIAPRKEHSVEVDDARAAMFLPPPEHPVDKKSLPPAERLDRSWVLPILIGAAGVFGIVKVFGAKGLAALDLNMLNFILLVIGLILHGNSKSFIESVQRGTSTVYGVIIQFPLYAGIFGMISFSGLAEIITKFFIDISTPTTFTWIVFLYTGIIDFFVPSAGSKFVIEAPYILPAAKNLGVAYGDVLNAYTAGSLWVNMINPFWALPVLGGFQIKFKDILPYTFIGWVWMFIVMSFSFLVLPKIL